MIYQITNRLGTSLTIEDIGIRLEAGSSITLQERSYNSSRLIKTYIQNGWIAVSQFAEAKKPIPIWPFSASPPTVAPTTVTDSSALQSVLARLEHAISSLQSNLVVAPSASLSKSTSAAQASDEPMFIPSQILPVDADVQINVDTSETENANYDSGLQALKNARRRK